MTRAAGGCRVRRTPARHGTDVAPHHRVRPGDPADPLRGRVGQVAAHGLRIRSAGSFPCLFDAFSNPKKDFR